MTVNPIESQASAAARSRNGNGRRPSARSRIEAAAAAAQAAEAAAAAAAQTMGELYANPLIAHLDAEGLGTELADPDIGAILHLVRSLEQRAPLPHRRPDGTGEQPAQRL